MRGHFRALCCFILWCFEAWIQSVAWCCAGCDRAAGLMPLICLLLVLMSLSTALSADLNLILNTRSKPISDDHFMRLLWNGFDVLCVACMLYWFEIYWIKELHFLFIYMEGGIYMESLVAYLVETAHDGCPRNLSNLQYCYSLGFLFVLF